MAGKKQEVVVRPTLTPTTWEEELAREAKVSAGVVENISVGKQFSLKNGKLSFNGAEMPNNEAVAVILDHVHAYLWYPNGFDPTGPNTPSCFAFGYDPLTMGPHENSLEPQSDLCKSCDMNQFGSGSGKGKACKNTMKLALLAAASFNHKTDEWELEEDHDAYKHGDIAFLNVSVTSVRSYAAYLKSLEGAMKRPAWSVVTRIRVEPHNQNQFQIKFELVDAIADPELLAILKARKEEAKSIIVTPWPKIEVTNQQPAKPTQRGKVPPQRARKY